MSDLERILDDYRLVLDEQFDSPTLDPSRWIPAYLPHWSGTERAAASYRLGGERLELFIGPDQPVWLPEIAPGMRVSSLQTGIHSGPVGSGEGQHRTDPGMFVVEQQRTQRLVTPHRGAVVIDVRWSPVPEQMVALWMIGVEETPSESAEICVFEIFGSQARDGEALVGMGVHPFGDPEIVDDFEKVTCDLNGQTSHTFAVVWAERDIKFFIDGHSARRIEQSPDYPMQLMLNIYDFSGGSKPVSTAPLVVDSLQIYQRQARG